MRSPVNTAEAFCGRPHAEDKVPRRPVGGEQLTDRRTDIYGTYMLSRVDVIHFIPLSFEAGATVSPMIYSLDSELQFTTLNGSRFFSAGF